jgi:hypothetical protein
MKTRRLAYSPVALLEGRPTTQSGVHPPLVIIGGKSIQLPTQVEAVVEESVIEILTPQSSDEPLDERMRSRREGDRLDFLDVENSQVRSPTIKPETRLTLPLHLLDFTRNFYARAIDVLNSVLVRRPLAIHQTSLAAAFTARCFDSPKLIV